MSMKFWPSATMAVIDIGYIEDGKVTTNSVCYVPALDLLLYLKAINEGTAPKYYPIDPKNPDLAQEETFAHYGGSMNNGDPIARIFKSGPRTEKDGKIYLDQFVWKAGVFKAKATKPIFVADRTKVVTYNSVRIARNDFREIAWLLETAMQTYACRLSTDEKFLFGED